MLHITALMDDKPSSRDGILAEHGLSLFLEYNGRRILFDCGASETFLHNAQALGVDLQDLDAVVLSHGHYDHGGGYPALIQSGRGSSRLFTGPGFFEPKYVKEETCYRDASAGFGKDFVECHGISHQEVLGNLELFPGLHLIGNFPRIHSLEVIPSRFVLQKTGQWVPDDFGDEICIAAEVEGGLAVLVGCSHPGILNMVAHIRQLLGKPVKAVFGGTHLVGADSQRILATIDGLCGAGVEILGLSHCSGEATVQEIQARGLQSDYLGAGDRFLFQA